ncbi:MAG: hypothetical protein ACI957_002447 [Verrucomicrobiales bacterium]|jgi:hypothetical protein
MRFEGATGTARNGGGLLEDSLTYCQGRDPVLKGIFGVEDEG